MNELELSFTLPLRLLPTMLFAWFYSLGGRSNKWLRRWFAPAIFTAGLVGISLLFNSFSPWLFLALLYIPALSLGYGGNTFLEKFGRRAVYGLSVGGIGILIASLLGVPKLGLFQLFLAFASSVYLGLANPIDAPLEEGLIACLMVICVPFMI